MAFQGNAFQHNAFQTGINGDGAVQAPLNVSVDMRANPVIRKAAAGYVHIGANLLLTTLAASVAATYQARDPLYSKPIQRAPVQQTQAINLLETTLATTQQAPFKNLDTPQPRAIARIQDTRTTNLLGTTLAPVQAPFKAPETVQPRPANRTQPVDVPNLLANTLVDPTVLRLRSETGTQVYAKRVLHETVQPNLALTTLYTVPEYQPRLPLFARPIQKAVAQQPDPPVNTLTTTLATAAPAQAPFKPMDPGIRVPRSAIQQPVIPENLLTTTLAPPELLYILNETSGKPFAKFVLQPQVPQNLLALYTPPEAIPFRYVDQTKPIPRRLPQQPDIGANLILNTLFVAPSTTPFTPIDLTKPVPRLPIQQPDWPTNLLQNTLFVEPPVVVPPPVEQTPAGRSKRHKRYYLEIDGQTFIVDSPAEALELLEKATALADKPSKAAAAMAVRRAIKAGKVPQSLRVPQVKSADPELQEIVLSAQKILAAIYDTALVDAEIKLRVAKQRQEDDNDDDDILLLM